MKKEGLWRANFVTYGADGGYLLKNPEVSEGCLTATLIGEYLSINTADDQFVEVKEHPQICLINTPVKLVEITDLMVLLNYSEESVEEIFEDTLALPDDVIE